MGTITAIQKPCSVSYGQQFESSTVKASNLTLHEAVIHTLMNKSKLVQLMQNVHLIVAV